MRPVSGLIPRIVGVVDKVPADQIIDIPVLIIVYTVFGLAGIAPDAGLVQIRMKEVDPGIDDGDDDRVGLAGLDFPRRRLAATRIEADSFQGPLILMALLLCAVAAKKRIIDTVAGSIDRYQRRDEQ